MSKSKVKCKTPSKAQVNFKHEQRKKMNREIRHSDRQQEEFLAYRREAQDRCVSESCGPEI